MRLILDTDRRTATMEDWEGAHCAALYSPAAFEWISNLWLKVGWNQKYTYSFSWLGRPVIQLPEDLVRVQEAVYRVKPDVIIETGVAHGGSLVFYASLCRCIGKGRVIGVDIEIRPRNRRAIERHPLGPLITLVEGNSVSPAVLSEVRGLVGAGESALVILDSCHTRAHVARELEAYCGFVMPDSYIVVNDGIMRDLADVPRGNPGWTSDNPASAVRHFLMFHPEFIAEQPVWPFNESNLVNNVTHWPEGWLRRL